MKIGHTPHDNRKDRFADSAYKLLLKGEKASENGDSVSAKEYFKAALKKSPQMEGAYFNLGLLFFKQGKFREALQYFREVINLNRQDHEAFYYMGLSCRHLGLSQESGELLKEAHRVDPQNPECALELAQPALQSGDYKRCLDILRCGESMDNADVLNLLGDCHRVLGTDGMAARYWEKSLMLDPHQPEVIEKLELLTKKKTVYHVNKKEIKLAVFSRINSFLGDLLVHFHKEYDVRVYSDREKSELFQLMEWCDTAYFEWCDQLLIEASRMPKVCKIVCRIHRYEVYTDLPKAVKWSNVDHVIMVSETIRQDFLDRFPVRTPISIVYNGLDFSKFPFQESKTYGKKIAYAGYIKPVKNPSLMVQCFYALKRYDPEFTFHIAGMHQDIAHELYFNDMLNRLGITVEHSGWVSNIAEWLADKDYIISTSVIESFQYSLVEGMAVGVLPLVHTWRGCEQFYPEEALFRTPEECVQRVKEYQARDMNAAAAKNRLYAESNFPVERMIESIDEILVSLHKQNKRKAQRHKGAKAQSGKRLEE